MYVKTADEIETTAAEIARENRLSMRAYFVFLVMGCVFCLLAGTFLFVADPDGKMINRCLGTSFLLLAVCMGLVAGISSRTTQKLLLNDCDYSTHRRVMQLQIPMPEYKRQVPALMLSVLTDSITLGDRDEARATVESLEKMRDKLKPTWKFALDLNKTVMAIIDAGNNKDLIEKARAELVQRWPNPPKQVDRNKLQLFLTSTDMRRLALDGDWNSFSSLLTSLPVQSISDECNYHMLRAKWCVGAGVSPVPDYTFVVEHGGDMNIAQEARKELAALAEQQRVLAENQKIPSNASRVDSTNRTNRITAVIFLICALFQYLIAIL